MPITSTARPILSDVLKGYSDFGKDNAIRYNFDTVAIEAGVDIGNIGIPLIWDNASSKFEVYVAQVIATVIATGGSPLENGSVVALAVGNSQGLGMNKADTDGTDPDAAQTVLFRGEAAIVDAGMVWGATAAPAQALFLAELALHGITTIANAEVVSPTYTS
jgi:hypothetical protein